MTTEFEVIQNDGDHQSMMHLISLKNLFARQLPKMPKDYIVRLVFDRRHYCYTMWKQATGGSDRSIVAGLCFRPFPDRGFAEVVFLAVAAGEQVKGHGTRLMNHFKEYCKTHLGIRYLLTYADNFAIGYFKKIGRAHV